MPRFSAAYRGHMVKHYTKASRGLVDMKPRKQVICNPRFEREIKLVKLQLNSNSQYFAILINSQSNNISRAKALSTGEIVIIHVRGERVCVKMGWKEKTERPKKARSKRRKESREKRAGKLERTPT